MPAHVFHIPQPYRSQDQEEPKRSKLRWFKRNFRLGSKRTKGKEPASTHTVQKPLSPPTSPLALVSAHKRHSDTLSSTASTTSSSTQDNDLKAASPSAGCARESIASTTSTTGSNTTVDGHAAVAPSTDALPPPAAHVEYEAPKLLRNVMGMDAKWTDDAHVMRHFAKLQWRVVRIQADGNCLFRAISDQIYRNEAFHGDIRRRVVEFIERETAFFQPFVENEHRGQFEPIAHYCRRMKRDAQWGGNPELYAAARLFNVHIVVHQGPMRRLRIENGVADTPGEPPVMELHLLFHKDHYDSLHDEASVHEKPRLSTSVYVAPIGLDDENPVEDDQRSEEGSQRSSHKKKKAKGVVFIGEETRVERLEATEIEGGSVPVRVPLKAVVRRGRVSVVGGLHGCILEEEPQESTGEVERTEEQSDSEDDNQQTHDTGMMVSRVTRVSFRRGRRVVEP